MFNSAPFFSQLPCFHLVKVNHLHALRNRKLAAEGNQAALFCQMAFSVVSKWVLLTAFYSTFLPQIALSLEVIYLHNKSNFCGPLLDKTFPVTAVK